MTGLTALIRQKRLMLFAFIWLASRAVLVWVLGAVPAPLYERLYGPFMGSFINSPTLDPWTNWLSSGGTPDAFPYGWPMLIVFSAGQAAGLIFGSGWFGFLATLLALDFLTLLLLIKFSSLKSEGDSFIAYAYLFSPLPVLSMLTAGSTDFVPMLFLFVAFIFMSANKPVLAGFMLGLAVGSKVVLAVVLVGAIVFYAKSQKNKKDTIALVSSMGVTLLAGLAPALYSVGFRRAVVSSEDATGPLGWGIPSPSGNLLLLPLVLIAVWFIIYQLKRMNRDLLNLAISTPILITAALPGASFGWSLWAFPLTILLAATLAPRFKMLVLLTINLTSFSHLVFLFEDSLTPALSDIQRGLVVTFTLAISVITLVLLWREHYTRSDFVRLRSRPALVLIAGDSGVGKDTLADGLTNILGTDSTVHVSGDDYHRWDRGHGSWEYLTHLNPLSNELPKFFNDILSLSDGRTIRAGKYDHRVGRRLSSRNARSREFVIGSGLHALMIPDVNRHSSLTVFLEMTEDLRANLKIMRDTESRGHAPEDVLRSIKERLEDSQKYVQPQRSLADLVVKTRVAEGSSTNDFQHLEIEFESESKAFDSQLVSELGMTCGLEVSLENVPGEGRRRICVRGSAAESDLSSAFENLEPRVSDILGGSSGWNKGPAGVVQMVTMVYLANSLRRERLVK